MHPNLLEQLTRQHIADRHADAAARARPSRALARHEGAATCQRVGARLASSVGWLLVDLGLRIATQRLRPETDPYAQIRG
jgi:hypothetical protein